MYYNISDYTSKEFNSTNGSITYTQQTPAYVNNSILYTEGSHPLYLKQGKYISPKFKIIYQNYCDIYDENVVENKVNEIQTLIPIRRININGFTQGTLKWGDRDSIDDKIGDFKIEYNTNRIKIINFNRNINYPWNYLKILPVENQINSITIDTNGYELSRFTFNSIGNQPRYLYNFTKYNYSRHVNIKEFNDNLQFNSIYLFT